MPAYATLVATVDGQEVVRFDPTKVLAREEFALGVISLEVERARRGIEGKMRATVTGRPAPATAVVAPGSVLQAFLHTAAHAPEMPALELPYVGGGIMGGCALYNDAKPVAITLLETRYAYDQPPPRAVGQIYCRWMRNGDMELGCDLRDFVAYGPGMKPPRLASRFVDQKSVISFALIGG